MIETVRARLTLWYVSILAAALIVVTALIYVLLARAMYARVDEAVVAGVQIAITSLANDLKEGEDQANAARRSAGELSSTRQMVATYDGSGRLLAEGGRDSDLDLTLPRCRRFRNTTCCFKAFTRTMTMTVIGSACDGYQCKALVISSWRSAVRWNRSMRSWNLYDGSSRTSYRLR